MGPDFYLWMLNRAKIDMWEDKGKHADVVPWNQPLNHVLQGRCCFSNGQRPLRSYLLQRKVFAGGICFDNSCFWPLITAYHHTLGYWVIFLDKSLPCEEHKCRTQRRSVIQKSDPEPLGKPWTERGLMCAVVSFPPVIRGKGERDSHLLQRGNKEKNPSGNLSS